MTPSRPPKPRKARGAPGGAGADLLHAMKQAAGLHRQGRLDAAIAAYRELLKQAPKLPEAHHNLGVAYRAKGELAAAAGAYRRALALAPGLRLGAPQPGRNPGL